MGDAMMTETNTTAYLVDQLNRGLEVRGIIPRAKLVPTHEPELMDDGIEVGLAERRPAVELRIAGGKVQVLRLAVIGGELERTPWGPLVPTWRVATVFLHVLAALGGIDVETAMAASPEVLNGHVRAHTGSAA